MPSLRIRLAAIFIKLGFVGLALTFLMESGVGWSHLIWAGAIVFGFALLCKPSS